MRTEPHRGAPPGERRNLKQQTIFGLTTFLACGHHLDEEFSDLPESFGLVTLKGLLHEAIPALEAESPGSLEYPVLLASHIRQWMGDIEAAHRLLIHLARCPEYGPILQRWIPSILTTPGEMAMLLNRWQRQFGGWTRSAGTLGMTYPIPAALNRGMRDAWPLFDDADFRRLSLRKRKLLRDWLRLNHLEPRNPREEAQFRDLGFTFDRQGNEVDFLRPEVRPGALPGGQLTPKDILVQLPTLIVSGAHWPDLERQLGDPATWELDIWPVLVFDRWLAIARMLPEGHPWHRVVSADLPALVPARTLVAICEYLDRAFLTLARRYQAPPDHRLGFLILDNDPELRNTQVDLGPWTYPVAALSMAGLMICSGHASGLWMLHPQFQCVVDEPMAQPLPLLARLLEKGKQAGSFSALGQVSMPSDLKINSYCWISQRADPPEQLQRAFRGRFQQLWLAPGKHLGHPEPDNQSCFAGLSPTLFEVMQQYRQTGQTWSDFVQSHPVRTTARPPVLKLRK